MIARLLGRYLAFLEAVEAEMDKRDPEGVSGRARL